MIYQTLLWTALFFIHAKGPHLHSRVDYGGKWASNILVRVGSYYCTEELDNVFTAHASTLQQNQKIETLICFLNSFLYMNVPLEIVIDNNYKFLLIHHNRAEGVFVLFKVDWHCQYCLRHRVPASAQV